MTFRNGIGYDVHPFAPGRRLILGGVEIQYHQGLAGHSDADVLLHAIADAILGAAALGDIGQHFPPSDPSLKGVDSLLLLGQVAAMLKEKGWQIENVDSTIVAESPRIMPHANEMCKNIAHSLNIPFGAVNVKATTNEGLGAIGRGEGIAAMAIATIRKTPKE